MRTTTPASMPGQKRKRADAAVKPARGDRGDDSEEWASEEQFDEADEEDEGYELNTDDEIEAAQAAGARSKKTASELKRRSFVQEISGATPHL